MATVFKNIEFETEVLHGPCYFHETTVFLVFFLARAFDVVFFFLFFLLVIVVTVTIIFLLFIVINRVHVLLISLKCTRCKILGNFFHTILLVVFGRRCRT